MCHGGRRGRSMIRVSVGLGIRCRLRVLSCVCIAVCNKVVSVEGGVLSFPRVLSYRNLEKSGGMWIVLCFNYQTWPEWPWPNVNETDVIDFVVIRSTVCVLLNSLSFAGSELCLYYSCNTISYWWFLFLSLKVPGFVSLRLFMLLLCRSDARKQAVECFFYNPMGAL